MISSADMILFAAVVREGSFTGAARHLGLTKQTVSERVARLEEWLGVRLLERTTRRLRVTDAGATYAERCASIALQIDEANSEVQQRQSEPTGWLRVTSPSLYGRRFLGPVIADYLGRYPKVRVEVVLSDHRVNLLEEGLDLAIRIGEMEDSSLTARKLGEGHVYIVASPGFLKQQGTPAPRDFRTARCIGMRPFETWEITGTQVKIEPVLVVNDLEIVCDAAIAGLGIARLPSLVCSEAIREGRLVRLFGSESTALRNVYAVYPSRKHLPAKVRLFIETLAALVEPMLPLPMLPLPTLPLEAEEIHRPRRALRKTQGHR